MPSLDEFMKHADDLASKVLNEGSSIHPKSLIELAWKLVNVKQAPNASPAAIRAAREAFAKAYKDRRDKSEAARAGK
jgi:hypothetical protein